MGGFGVKRGLLSQIRTPKLSYFDHIARHDSLQKTVRTGRICGRRGRGKPTRQWYDFKKMDRQPVLHEHQASPGSCDLEKRGKSTPEWPSTARVTRTTATTTKLNL